MADIEIILATIPKICSQNFKNIPTKDYSETLRQKILEVQIAIWSDYKHHNRVEFLVCVFPNLAVTLAQ